jgi:TonB family protein
MERPQLPVGTKDARFLGRLTLRVRIDAEGKPLQAEILKSTNKIFDGPMVNAILKSQFTPARTSSGPVDSWVVIPINLEDIQ